MALAAVAGVNAHPRREKGNSPISCTLRWPPSADTSAEWKEGPSCNCLFMGQPWRHRQDKGKQSTASLRRGRAGALKQKSRDARCSVFKSIHESFTGQSRQQFRVHWRGRGGGGGGRASITTSGSSPCQSWWPPTWTPCRSGCRSSAPPADWASAPPLPPPYSRSPGCPGPRLCPGWRPGSRGSG